MNGSGLPPGDPARCDTRLRAQLLDRLPVPPAVVHTIEVDAPDLDVAVARHAAAASDLDLVVLGLGMNGHVGFNEPGSRPDSPTRIVRLAASSRQAAMARYGASRVPSAGITVGMDLILGAREVWLLVTGERKAQVLRRALRDPVGPDCPASFLRGHANALDARRRGGRRAPGLSIRLGSPLSPMLHRASLARAAACRGQCCVRAL